jgi:hypothetical protein
MGNRMTVAKLESNNNNNNTNTNIASATRALEFSGKGLVINWLLIDC